ncbi:MAG: aminodeoxychorismate synthase component I [Melioribacteraceae bacterium]
MNILDILNTVKENTRSVFLYTPPIYDNAVSYILNNPQEIITCNDLNYVNLKLNEADNLTQKGLTGFVLFNYELGYAFENNLNKYLSKENNTPLFTILFFNEKNITRIVSKEIDFDKAKELLQQKNYSINSFRLNTTKKNYIKNIEAIKKYIKIGDTYQVNYTVEGKFKFKGSVESLFLSTLFNQSAQFSALINLDDEIIISNSPELFFKIKDNVISTRPMKGTIKRGINILDDSNKCSQLLSSEKDRAENIMIVDLLRNDIGRVSKLNSVKVTSKFNLEKYETIYQLTSEVEGKLKKQNLYSILRNTFPCGSITGAPKIRTMEIINKLENRQRGIYTGSIGMFDKHKAIFNVAIRTIQIAKKTGKGNIGIGSGIVWDSNANSEYNETKLKAKFLTNPDPYFELIESLLLENGSYFLLDEHLNRLEQASEHFLFVFDKKSIEKKLNKLKKKLKPSLEKSYKIKLLLDKWGSVELTSEEIKNKKYDNLKIKISDVKINSKNKFQYFKTTNRVLYDEEFKLAIDEGYDEVIFLNEKDEIAEGSISNIFIKNKTKFITPKISSGILNGIYREHFILNNKNVFEKKLKLNDIVKADELYLVNSVRKKMRITEVWRSNTIILRLRSV